jgi:SAM-dependent methyltransferase
MYDTEGRLQKARKTIAVLRDAMNRNGIDPARARLLDIGCSTGILTHYYGDHLGAVVGIDIDDGAVAWANANRAADNVEYRVGDSLDLPFEDAVFDLAACTHIYEHVPDPGRMLDEIFRVLRPGGLCYFAAENRLRFWDGHYDLPLVTVVPRPVANLMLRVTGRGRHRYETHATWWGLRHLAGRFEILDYTERVVRDPSRFDAMDMIRPGSFKQRIALGIVRLLPWLSPTYLWVLRKPTERE